MNYIAKFGLSNPLSWKRLVVNCLLSGALCGKLLFGAGSYLVAQDTSVPSAPIPAASIQEKVVDGPIVLSSTESAAIASYIEQARQRWQVPGLAVAVVKDDQVILSQGFGKRQVDRDEPVDQETLFAIASNSKAFTAAALAILVDEGKLSWDDPVRKHLPWFELYDPYVSNDIRVRDLLCHRSGLGTFSGDLLWYGTSYTPEEILKRCRYLKPEFPFRSDFGYSNVMFLAAGEVIAAVSGESWQSFVEKRILQPLQMQRSVTSIRDLVEKGNFATPHKTKLDGSKPIAWFNWDAMAAAGGIISSSDDMAQWMRMQLKSGKLPDGKPLFSESNWYEMLQAHTPNRVPKESSLRYPSTHFRAYGLGWVLADYKGKKVVTHSGGYDGMYSRVMLIPEEKLGIVVLTNSMTGIGDSLAYGIADAYLGGATSDWVGDGYRNFTASRRGFYQRIEQAVKAPATTPPPSVDLATLTGVYGGELYGDADVRLEDGKLVLQFQANPELVAELKHSHRETFVIQWRNEFAWFEEGTAQFLLDSHARPTEIKLDVPNEDLWFYELELKRK